MAKALRHDVVRHQDLLGIREMLAVQKHLAMVQIQQVVGILLPDFFQEAQQPVAKADRERRVKRRVPNAVPEFHKRRVLADFQDADILVRTHVLFIEGILVIHQIHLVFLGQVLKQQSGEFFSTRPITRHIRRQKQYSHKYLFVCFPIVFIQSESNSSLF